MRFAYSYLKISSQKTGGQNCVKKVQFCSFLLYISILVNANFSKIKSDTDGAALVVFIGLLNYQLNI